MENRNLVIAAVVLVVAGAIGALISLALMAESANTGSFSSPGQRIYYTGTDATGSPIPRSVAGGGMMGRGVSAMACVDCHGTDGRGGPLGMMFSGVDVPDIRYSTLTTSRSENGTTTAGWTDADIVRVIRDGTEPDGQRIKSPMPRWAMTDMEVAEVIAYLKELSRQ